LAIASLPNVGGEFSGKICFGKNQIPEARAQTIEAVWNLIFNASFNRDNVRKKKRQMINRNRNGRKLPPESEINLKILTMPENQRSAKSIEKFTTKLVVPIRAR